jgi:hypothetical protein
VAARVQPQSKVKIATEADWGFLESAALEGACRGAAARAAASFNIDFEDALQSAYLTLAVRPEWHGRPGERVQQDVYVRLRAELVSEAPTVSLTAMEKAGRELEVEVA